MSDIDCKRANCSADWLIEEEEVGEKYKQLVIVLATFPQYAKGMDIR